MKIRKLLSIVLTAAMLLGCMSFTAFAEEETICDYGIVLSGGKALKRVVTVGYKTVGYQYVSYEIKGDITSEVAGMGLTYSNGVWTMNNFTFKTNNPIAFTIVHDCAINLIGINNIIQDCSTVDYRSPVGMEIIQTLSDVDALEEKSEVKFTGTGTLKIDSTNIGDYAALEDENGHLQYFARNTDGIYQHQGYCTLHLQDSVKIEISASADGEGDNIARAISGVQIEVPDTYDDYGNPVHEHTLTVYVHDEALIEAYANSEDVSNAVQKTGIDAVMKTPEGNDVTFFFFFFFFIPLKFEL